MSSIAAYLRLARHALIPCLIANMLHSAKKQDLRARKRCGKEMLRSQEKNAEEYVVDYVNDVNTKMTSTPRVERSRPDAQNVMMSLISRKGNSRRPSVIRIRSMALRRSAARLFSALSSAPQVKFDKISFFSLVSMGTSGWFIPFYRTHRVEHIVVH